MDSSSSPSSTRYSGRYQRHNNNGRHQGRNQSSRRRNVQARQQQQQPRQKQQQRRQQHQRRQASNNSPRRIIFRPLQTNDPAILRNAVQQQQRSSPPVRIFGPGEDSMGVFLGPRYRCFHDVQVPGQSRDDRFAMIRQLRSMGFLDGTAYPTTRDFIESLPHLFRRQDITFAMDIRVFNYVTCSGWAKDGTFDYLISSRVYDAILDKRESIKWSTIPHRQTKYARDLSGVVAEW